MRMLKDFPKPVIGNAFSVFLIGIGCLVVGIAVYTGTGDKTMLLLSLALFLASLFKACNVLFISVHRKYNTITGTCVSIRRQAFKRKNEVILADDDNKELTLYLPCKYKLQEGTAYIFYFKNHSIGDQLDVNLLGFGKWNLEH